MNKQSTIFGVAGLLAGLLIGFMFANSINQKGATPVSAEARSNSNMPPGHPDISGSGSAPGSTGAMPAQTQAVIDKAKQSPTDFDAQIAAADLYYQIERYPEAISFLQAANKLKPEDREVIVHLGNANFDAGNYEEAEKWYGTALAKKDDVNVRTDLGLTFVFRDKPDYDKAITEFNKSLAIDPNHIQALQNLTVAYTKKGDAAKAGSTLSKLESVDPKNAAISKLKEDIQKMTK
ncbi:MAG: tetratricopeptide repeat protein [Pyrinomonadaceae bacterium]